ncbi:putative baseplate assembly protein [Conexibacter sp. W3-3-2]|uniref:Putative baseplate assembly protein n=1 Tax=Paraconexibacter algicola TaxID=2133960 RepID=A0A2T4UGF1_9ACTN|nr:MULTISPECIES: putative baseplate assembly protein [Solirubrobacterales]MTD44539.1 putative baseplate assembly protein [Conexibacter sp. W3-3-2]PTL58287.1 putative baseplate assembly protein [Paraconexibacter algicola]
MRLPEIELDDRRFQELVSEARTRIARVCPEWTEHNVSDPGITLIELFAWMTEMTIYRLNRVPDKVHVQLLDLLGVRLRPPAPARTDVRILLSAPPDEPIEIRAGETEVANVPAYGAPEVVFQVSQGRVIEPLQASACVLTRSGEVRVVPLADGIARPVGPDQAAFATPPQPGDAVLLGFEPALDGLVLELDVEAESARGAGVDPDRPPLRWEVIAADDRWEPCEVLLDTTGGFNFGSGRIVLALPPESTRASFGGERLHWIRCRLLDPFEGGGAYQEPPRLLGVGATVIGATVPAEHATRVEEEPLGESDGTAGQTFELRSAPILAPRGDEVLEVRVSGGRWQPWQPVESFADAGPDDHVYVCDPATGTVELGPALRQPDGSWRRHGAVPEKGALLRMRAYRHGGGREGNVTAGALSVLKNGPSGVAEVVNPRAAAGGVDAEPLDSVRARGPMELRARHRAVTAEDFEHLTREASPRVARVVCVPPDEGSAIAVRLLPTVFPADRPLTFEELQPPRDLLEEVAAHLDQRRLLGATVHVAPVRLRAVSIVVDVQTEPLADTERIREETEQALYTFLNPLVGGTPGEIGTGWEFGRTLNQGELYGVVHAVPGVEYVRLLRVYEADLRTGKQAPEPAGTHVVLQPDEVIASGRHVVKATIRGT